MSDFDFSELMQQRQEGLVLAPMLRTFLYNAEFPDSFSVHFSRGDQGRDADGWFWPSTHPTWPLRALWLYLNDPEALPTEDRAYMNTLSLTMGSAIHGFIETCLNQMGLRTPDLNACHSCPPEKGCTEPGFRDDEAGSRGHMDGRLDLSSLKPLPPSVPEQVGFEFKTASPRVLSRLEDLNLSLYRKHHPTYYAQNQEYMELSGERLVIVLFMGLGYPWPMKEVHVPYDEAYSTQTRDRYRAVREAAEMPACCNQAGCFLKGWCSSHKAPETPFLMPRSAFRGRL